MARQDPRCRVHWSLLAGIGRVESNHGRYGGAGIAVDGRVSPPILGIRLDGSRPGTARISDSDGGRFDGDRAFDRAVGPMQFLPGTWAIYGGDGTPTVRNPQDLDDAALGAARYLCAGSGDFRPAPDGGPRCSGTTTPTATSRWCCRWPTRTPAAGSAGSPSRRRWQPDDRDPVRGRPGHAARQAARDRRAGPAGQAQAEADAEPDAEADPGHADPDADDPDADADHADNPPPRRRRRPRHPGPDDAAA